MPINHLDLFSGIGGFAYAVDQVWPGSTHTFCDNNLFCQKVLAKHWPESEIYGDIRTIADTKHNGGSTTKETGQNSGTQSKSKTRKKLFKSEPERNRLLWSTETRWDLLTGGFPCQPFSQAGKRRGTADDRYLWPEMLRVIQLTKPTWIIGENVPGIINIENGMVFEQVCTDLENEGYEVQPFIIPACSVNAPHRRDRVWIVANKYGTRLQKEGAKQQATGTTGKNTRDVADTKSWESRKQAEGKWREGIGGRSKESIDANPTSKGLEGSDWIQGERCTQTDWNKDWLEVATSFCGVDDGVSNRVDRLKALGNAIVPQVAMEIMKAINYAS